MCLKGIDKKNCPITKIEMKAGKCDSSVNCVSFGNNHITFSKKPTGLPLARFEVQTDTPCKMEQNQPTNKAKEDDESVNNNVCETDNRWQKVGGNLGYNLEDNQVENNIKKLIDKPGYYHKTKWNYWQTNVAMESFKKDQ